MIRLILALTPLLLPAAVMAQVTGAPRLLPVSNASPQQSPAGDTSVSVPAATSTLVWTASTAVRVLRLIPSNTTCLMQADATAAASGGSTPIPGGYVFNLIEPPPNRSIYAYCTSAATIAVSAGQ